MQHTQVVLVVMMVIINLKLVMTFVSSVLLVFIVKFVLLP